MRRVIVCGGRRWRDRFRLEARLEMIPQPFVLVHGGCDRGADAIANEWATTQPNVTVERHPAEWSKFGDAAGPIRNRYMAHIGADLCLAFPSRDSRGTWGMIDEAKTCNIPVEIDRE